MQLGKSAGSASKQAEKSFAGGGYSAPADPHQLRLGEERETGQKGEGDGREDQRHRRAAANE